MSMYWFIPSLINIYIFWVAASLSERRADRWSGLGRNLRYEFVAGNESNDS